MAARQLSKDQWAIVGLLALAVVTAILVGLAILKTWSPATVAVPAPVVADAVTPTPTPTPTATAVDLAAIADTLASPDGASILVLGDGSGDDDDEWVSLWARDHLARDASVAYHAWDRSAAAYRDAVSLGSAGPEVSVWNASVSAPNLTREPDRLAQAWQEADVVLLSYGHRREAKKVGQELDAVLAAVRERDDSVPVLVLIQNPDPTATEAGQKDTTRAITKWADRQDLPTVDIYSAFTGDPAPRSALVESDGSPTPEGSALWAKALDRAVATA